MPCQVIVVSLYVAVLVAAVFLFQEFAVKFTDVRTSQSIVLLPPLPALPCNCS